MTEILEVLKPLVDATVQRLNKKGFLPDPIAGNHFSKIVSVMSSAYKRHGYILERALLEQLKLCPDFEVWNDPAFFVTHTADLMVDGALHDPMKLDGSETGYQAGHRTLQVDAVVFNKMTGALQSYEIKRGAGLHDSGKRRSILRDLLCTQVLLRSYGKSRNLDVKTTSSHIIFYYGMCSIRRPYSLTRNELDDHFQWPVLDAVEAVNSYFQSRLFQILAG